MYQLYEKTTQWKLVFFHLQPEKKSIIKTFPLRLESQMLAVIIKYRQHAGAEVLHELLQLQPKIQIALRGSRLIDFCFPVCVAAVTWQRWALCHRKKKVNFPSYIDNHDQIVTITCYTYTFAHCHQSSIISMLTHKLTCSVNGLCWKVLSGHFQQMGFPYLYSQSILSPALDDSLRFFAL